MITVKVMQIPGAIREVALEDGATVADALTAAQMSLHSNYVLKVDGSEADESDMLRDGQNVTMSASAKGNA